MKRLSGIVLAALMVMAAMSSSGWAATAAPVGAEDESGGSVSATSVSRTAPAPAADDAQRLGARERQANAKGLPDFEGGESSVGIYIGGSALTIALLVVLLIILI